MVCDVVTRLGKYSPSGTVLFAYVGGSSVALVMTKWISILFCWMGSGLWWNGCRMVVFCLKKWKCLGLDVSQHHWLVNR